MAVISVCGTAIGRRVLSCKRPLQRNPEFRELIPTLKSGREKRKNPRGKSRGFHCGHFVLMWIYPGSVRGVAARSRAGEGRRSRRNRSDDVGQRAGDVRFFTSKTLPPSACHTGTRARLASRRSPIIWTVRRSRSTAMSRWTVPPRGSPRRGGLARHRTAEPVRNAWTNLPHHADLPACTRPSNKRSIAFLKS